MLRNSSEILIMCLVSVYIVVVDGAACSDCQSKYSTYIGGIFACRMHRLRQVRSSERLEKDNKVYNKDRNVGGRTDKEDNGERYSHFFCIYRYLVKAALLFNWKFSLLSRWSTECVWRSIFFISAIACMLKTK